MATIWKGRPKSDKPTRREINNAVKDFAADEHGLVKWSDPGPDGKPLSAAVIAKPRMVKEQQDGWVLHPPYGVALVIGRRCGLEYVRITHIVPVGEGAIMAIEAKDKIGIVAMAEHIHKAEHWGGAHGTFGKAAGGLLRLMGYAVIPEVWEVWKDGKPPASRGTPAPHPEAAPEIAENDSEPEIPFVEPEQAPTEASEETNRQARALGMAKDGNAELWKLFGSIVKAVVPEEQQPPLRSLKVAQSLHAGLLKRWIEMSMAVKISGAMATDAVKMLEHIGPDEVPNIVTAYAIAVDKPDHPLRSAVQTMVIEHLAKGQE